MLFLCWLLPFLSHPTSSLFSDLESLSLTLSFMQDQAQQDQDFELTVQKNENKFSVEEKIKNGSFENAKQDWSWIGLAEVKLATDSWTAVEGDHYLQLGQSDRNLRLDKNCLSQEINLENKTWPQLHLYYAVFSQENNLGFDRPKFVVLINDEIIFLETETQDNWQDLWLDLSRFQQKQVEFKICAGNSGDNQSPSWAKIDAITFTDLALRDSDLIRVKAVDSNTEVGYFYQIEGDKFTDFAIGDLELYLPESKQINEVEILIREDQEIVRREPVNVWVDEVPPAKITDLELIQEADDQVSAYFSSEGSSLNLTMLEFKSGTEQLDQEAWSSLVAMELDFLTLDDFYIFDQFWIPLAIDSESEDAWGAVKLKDAAGNLSPISNLAKIQEKAPIQSSSIRMNEILFNPDGNDYGQWQESEWIELHNSSHQPVDLSNWWFEDEANNVINLTKDNCDNNHDFTDTGEVVIMPDSYLIVYVNGAPVLNNSGDTISLYNAQNEKVDEHQYQGVTSQGKTTGRDLYSPNEWLTNLGQTPLGPNVAN